MSHWLMLLISVCIPLIIGFLGAYFTYREIPTWYARLVKPSWNPPNWIFGPVWTILYILMGIALYIIWKSPVDESVRRPAMILFLIQLVLNFFWSVIFFNKHELGIALVEILTLWTLIIITIFSFATISNLAAWLLVPYVSWVSFATILNYKIWRLNK